MDKGENCLHLHKVNDKRYMRDRDVAHGRD